VLTVPELSGEVIVGIQNASASTATVIVSRYGQRDRYQTQLGAYSAQQIRIGTGLTMEIRADVPVAVGAVHQQQNGAGLSSVPGIKFSEENK